MASNLKKKPAAQATSVETAKVISGPPWNYHERVNDAVGVISAWYKKQSAVVRAKLDRNLDQLRPLKKNQWGRPRASPLKNHIYVIRFTDENSTQIRIFGHFYDAHAVFVMTFDGYEKDNVYYPKNYQKLAGTHKSSCDSAFLPSTQRFHNRCNLCLDAVACSVKH